jgi:DNA-binding CsgD family transcriptional regulator
MVRLECKYANRRVSDATFKSWAVAATRPWDLQRSHGEATPPVRSDTRHFHPAGAMTMFAGNPEVCQLGTEEERILASFSRRLIEIAAGAGSIGSGISAIAALNTMRLPAIALDRRGFVLEVNAAADAIFDNDVKIKDKRLFVRDLKAHALLKASLDDLTNPGKSKCLIAEPIIVQRPDKLPVIVRIWPFEGLADVPNQDVGALVTLNALGPKPGPASAILAKTFRLTPSEAKLACIIARGVSPQIAARQLKISRETARNQLKSVFAKTDTHRQSELVALLLQVE